MNEVHLIVTTSLFLWFVGCMMAVMWFIVRKLEEQISEGWSFQLITRHQHTVWYEVSSRRTGHKLSHHRSCSADTAGGGAPQVTGSDPEAHLLWHTLSSNTCCALRFLFSFQTHVSVSLSEFPINTAECLRWVRLVSLSIHENKADLCIFWLLKQIFSWWNISCRFQTLYFSSLHHVELSKLIYLKANLFEGSYFSRSPWAHSVMFA